MSALTYAEYLMVISKLETMYNALHVRVGGLANYHAAKQGMQPSPANSALVAVLRYEAEALGQTRARIEGYRRDAIAADVLTRDMPFADIVAEDRISTLLKTGVSDSGEDDFSENSGDVQVVDLLRMGHSDAPESRAA